LPRRRPRWAACGGDDDARAAATPASTTMAEAWKRIVPVAGCQCSDGSEFSFWVREASPKTVAFSLQDVGARFSAETCAPPHGDLYDISIGSDDGPEQGVSYPRRVVCSQHTRRSDADSNRDLLRDRPIRYSTSPDSAQQARPTRLGSTSITEPARTAVARLLPMWTPSAEKLLQMETF
jgi:hypothetical protein